MESDKAIAAALKADLWDEAIARGEEMLALRLRVQGPKHYETVNEEWRLKALRRIAAMAREDRADYLSSITKTKEGEDLYAQGKCAHAQPLFEKALAIRGLLLGDDYPQTAESYKNVAEIFKSQAKYAQAQPLYTKALEIRRRLLTDDHPLAAISYSDLAINHRNQGNFAEAQQLFLEALEINRRVLTDNHPDTAVIYNYLGYNLFAQKKYTEAQPLLRKALDLYRRLLTDDHVLTALGYYDVAANLRGQGRYAEAQRLFEKALEIRHRSLGDDHFDTAWTHSSLGGTLHAQGNYVAARDRWLSAVRSIDAARLRTAFTGLERAATVNSPRLPLAAVLARLNQPAEAWQTLEQDLGRGLLDEVASRKDWRLESAERDQLRQLTVTLEQLNPLLEATPEGLDQPERAKLYEELCRKRERASIDLSELQSKLDQEHGELEGHVASLDEVQAALPADAALVAWVDAGPIGPNDSDPDGDHWGVVVRSRGIPSWIPIPGTGAGGLWSKDDTALANQVRSELHERPDGDPAHLRHLIAKLRTQRLEPLRGVLAATTDGLPSAQTLIVLPSHEMAGIPVEALLATSDTRTVSYAPSATIFKYLRAQPNPGRHAGLLALGFSVYLPPDKSSEPDIPDHGLLVDSVVPGSNAATHGLMPGDVILSYNGISLFKPEDLTAEPEPGKPVVIEYWRGGKIARLELAPGNIDISFNRRPAPLAIAEERTLNEALMAARSGSEVFDALPWTQYEVDTTAELFRADDRPARVLLGAEANEPELDRLATSGELGRFGVIHLATHAVIGEGDPDRSAVILTQTGLPDPLEQARNDKPVYDGRLSVREIRRGWDLKAELVTLSACETALGRDSYGEGFIGFTQALLLAGARTVCLSLWKVDDRATSLLMTRFYQNLLGKRPGLDKPVSKTEALCEAKQWLRGLSDTDIKRELKQFSRSVHDNDTTKSPPLAAAHPFEHPFYWAGFILVGDPFGTFPVETHDKVITRK